MMEILSAYLLQKNINQERAEGFSILISSTKSYTQQYGSSVKMLRNPATNNILKLLENSKRLFGYDGAKDSIDDFRLFFTNIVLKSPKIFWNDEQVRLFWSCIRFLEITEFQGGRFPKFEGFGTIANEDDTFGSNFWTKNNDGTAKLTFKNCEFEDSAMFLSDATKDLSFSDCRFGKDSYLCGDRKRISILRCVFMGGACLNASKIDEVFISDSDFNASFTSKGVIGKYFTICGSKFEHRAEFTGCKVLNLKIDNCEFKEDIWALALTIWEKFSIYESSVDGNVFTDGLRLPGSECEIDLRRSRISGSFSLNLEDPSDFDKMKIGLYLSSVPNFFSDQSKISLAKPLSENLRAEEDAKISFFDAGSFNDDKSQARHVLEIQLHEVRLLRNISKKLGMHEMDDLLYGKEMELSMRIKMNFGGCGDLLSGWLSLMGFGKMFGWGVKIRNLILTGFIILFSFFGWYYFNGNVFKYGDGKSVILSGDVWNCAYLSAISFFGGTMPNFADGITQYGESLERMVFLESVLGLLWISFFIAFLSRKFMRF